VTKHEFLVRNRDRLMLDRLLVIEEPITSALADRMIARMLDLEAASRADIYLCIAGPGGDLKAGLAIYEAIRFTACEVVTVGIGDTASTAALLLASGSRGRRTVLSSARITVHPPRADRRSPDDLSAAHMRRLNTLVFRILSAHIGRPSEAIEADAQQERTFTAIEAQAYGIVDAVDEVPAAARCALRTMSSLRSV
jgi:ATP-dependent Clp protease protease subunit